MGSVGVARIKKLHAGEKEAEDRSPTISEGYSTQHGMLELIALIIRSRAVFKETASNAPEWSDATADAVKCHRRSKKTGATSPKSAAASPCSKLQTEAAGPGPRPIG
jgi:hypothetical protein